MIDLKTLPGMFLDQSKPCISVALPHCGISLVACNAFRINGRQMIQVSDEDLIAECRNILGLNITQVTEPSAQQARQTAQESSTTRIPVVVAVAVPAVARAQGINTAASPGPPHASPAIQPDEAPPPFSFEALFGPTS